MRKEIGFDRYVTYLAIRQFDVGLFHAFRRVWLTAHKLSCAARAHVPTP
jgi:hypothetical protein